MMKMNLQFLHIKRELVLQRTDVTLNQRDWAQKGQTDSLLRLETSFTDSVEQRSIRA